jgi:hypothetical protein
MQASFLFMNWRSQTTKPFMNSVHEGLHPFFLAHQTRSDAVLRSIPAFSKTGLLALGSIYSPHLPIFPTIQKNSGFTVFVPDHSGGTTPESHRIPC